MFGLRNPSEIQVFGNWMHNPMGIIPPQILEPDPVEEWIEAGKIPASPSQANKALIRDLPE